MIVVGIGLGPLKSGLMIKDKVRTFTLPECCDGYMCRVRATLGQP